MFTMQGPAANEAAASLHETFAADVDAPRWASGAFPVMVFGNVIAVAVVATIQPDDALSPVPAQLTVGLDPCLCLSASPRLLAHEA